MLGLFKEKSLDLKWLEDSSLENPDVKGEYPI